MNLAIRRMASIFCGTILDRSRYISVSTSSKNGFYLNSRLPIYIVIQPISSFLINVLANRVCLKTTSYLFSVLSTMFHFCRDKLCSET